MDYFCATGENTTVSVYICRKWSRYHNRTSGKFVYPMAVIDAIKPTAQRTIDGATFA